MPRSTLEGRRDVRAVDVRAARAAGAARVPAPSADAAPVDAAPVALADCAVARALAAVGERWALLVLREVFYGVRRFDAMQADLGVAKNVLSDRLRRLVAEGVLARAPYREAGRRTQYEYHLTPAGADLLPVLAALMTWGDRHRPHPDGPSLGLADRATGRPVRAALVRDDSGAGSAAAAGSDGSETAAGGSRGERVSVVADVRALRPVLWPGRAAHASRAPG